MNKETSYEYHVVPEGKTPTKKDEKIKSLENDLVTALTFIRNSHGSPETSPCRIDCNDDCQEHFYFGLEPDEECPAAAAIQLTGKYGIEEGY